MRHSRPSHQIVDSQQTGHGQSRRLDARPPVLFLPIDNDERIDHLESGVTSCGHGFQQRAPLVSTSSTMTARSPARTSPSISLPVP